MVAGRLKLAIHHLRINKETNFLVRNCDLTKSIDGQQTVLKGKHVSICIQNKCGKFWGFNSKTPLAAPLALSQCDSTFQLSLYFDRLSQCCIKMSQSIKILHATVWHKIVTTCSQNLLYVTSVTKIKKC